MVVFVSQQKELLQPLSNNRPPALFYIAGKTILEWFLIIGKKFNIKNLILLSNKDDRRILYDQLAQYMEPSAPINEIGPFTILDYDAEKGITNRLKKDLIEGYLSDYSILLDGNLIFNEYFLKNFLEKEASTNNYALVDENDNCLGIGFFKKNLLNESLVEAKCVNDIYHIYEFCLEPF